MPVLQLALKFSYGNRALRDSEYSVFKFTRKAEVKALSKSLIQSFKQNNKSGTLSNSQLQTNKNRNNILLTLLNQKVAFRVWKEYMLIRDKFAAREGIISERELNRLISKQRTEEIKYYNKQNSTLAFFDDTDEPVRKASMQMIESFRNIHMELRSGKREVTQCGKKFMPSVLGSKNRRLLRKRERILQLPWNLSRKLGDLKMPDLSLSHLLS